MPPKAKFTREEIVAAAVDVIREKGLEAITAQEMGRRLGSSTRPLFTYFSTLEELRAAAAAQARRIYNGYAEEGLSMTPAFKGFGMAYIRFAREEPSLFRLLFMRKADPADLADVLDREGHLPLIRKTVMETFRLDRAQADWLYENLWIYAHGLAAFCASGAVQVTEEAVAFLEARGFHKARHDVANKTIDTGSSRINIMVSPSGFILSVSQHIKDRD